MNTGASFEEGYKHGLSVADTLWIKPWPINHTDAHVGRVVAQRQRCCFSPDQQKSGEDTNVEKKGVRTGKTRIINHCWNKETDSAAAVEDPSIAKTPHFKVRLCLWCSNLMLYDKDFR